jgi:hypothetical protein
MQLKNKGRNVCTHETAKGKKSLGIKANLIIADIMCWLYCKSSLERS